MTDCQSYLRLACLLATVSSSVTSPPAPAYWDLYLDLAEMKRLLGLRAELYYVRNGEVNEYALSYLVQVPPHLSQLHFTWQSHSLRPLYYSLSSSREDKISLLDPQFNISTEGVIPKSVSTFSVSLLCSGLRSAQVNLSLELAVSTAPGGYQSSQGALAPAASRTRSTYSVQLVFKRRKTCYEVSRGGDEGGGGEAGGRLEDLLREGRGGGGVRGEASPAVYFGISCACALASLFAIALLACYMRTSKHQQPLFHSSRLLRLGSDSDSSSCSLTSSRQHQRAVSAVPSLLSTVGGGGGGGATLPLPAPPPPSSDLQHRLATISVQRCRVRLKSCLLEGTFGRVYRGSYTSPQEGIEKDILVKTVSDQASPRQVSLLIEEGMSFYGLSHKHILSVCEVCLEEHSPVFLIYPNNGYINLKKFLQKCKVCPEGVAHTLTTQEVVDMALQALSGVQYLHKKKLLHKDLATRNCIVDEKLRVQICDQALSRDLFPADYHCLGDNENRPIKWLAFESIQNKTFTTASDVWMFGVLLWELTTLAQQPYLEVDPFEMAAYLSDGYRLAQPTNCPDELFGVMAYCWALSPDERPTFPQLQLCLQEFYTQLTRYV